MSGAEAVAVLGIITSIITIVETSKKICDAAQNESGLHESIRKIAEDIPFVLQTLRKVRQVQEVAIRENLHTQDVEEKRAIAEISEGVQPIVSACEKNAQALQQIFENCLPGIGASRFSRYSKAVRGVVPGQTKKVEQMFKDMLQKLQLLAQYQIFENAIASAEISTAMQRFHGATKPMGRGLEPANTQHSGTTSASENKSKDKIVPGPDRLSSKASQDFDKENPLENGRYKFTYNNCHNTKVASQGPQVINGGQNITF